MQKAKTFQDWMSLFHNGSFLYLQTYLNDPDYYEKEEADDTRYMFLKDGSILFESREYPECGLLVTLVEKHQFSIKSVVMDSEQLKVIEESVLYDVDAGLEAIVSYLKNVVGIKGNIQRHLGVSRCKM